MWGSACRGPSHLPLAPQLSSASSVNDCAKQCCSSLSGKILSRQRTLWRATAACCRCATPVSLLLCWRSESPRPSTSMKNCVVTGANQGIGYEIVRQIAQRGGMRAVLAARSEERGRAALAKLQSELPAEAAGRVEYHQLDITDAASIDAFAGWAREELGGSIDVLVNNAGGRLGGWVAGWANC